MSGLKIRGIRTQLIRIYAHLINALRPNLVIIVVAGALAIQGEGGSAEEECGAFIANGCFEAGKLNGWTKRYAKVSTGMARTGSYSAQLGNGKARSGTIAQTIRHLEPKTRYVAEAWFAASSGNPIGRLVIAGYGGKVIVQRLTLTPSWQSVRLEFTTGPRARSARISCQAQGLTGNGGVAFCDDIYLLPMQTQQTSPATIPPSAEPQPVALPTATPTEHPSVDLQPNPSGTPISAPLPSIERGSLLWQIGTCGNCHGGPALLIAKLGSRQISLHEALSESISNDAGGMGQFSHLSALDMLDIEAYLNSPTTASGPPIQSVSWISNATTLRKASIQLAGRLPMESEIVLAETDDGLRRVLRGLMQGARFDEFVRDTVKRHFLSDGANLDDAAIQDDFPVLKTLVDMGMGEEYYSRKADMQQEPVELVRHVVLADRPYSEIVTAAYTMVTPALAETYGATLLQPFQTGESTEWVPATLPFTSARTAALHDKPYPHAGVLSTRSWLTRFSTTDTNRNRHRAKSLMRQFLGYDIEALGQRPVDDSQNGDYLVPTMENPNCKLCHTRMEPIAGTFMDWGSTGQFWENDGQDSLADSYKSRAYYLDQDNAAWYSAGDKWYRDMFLPGFQDKNMPGGRFGFNQPDPATALVPKATWTLIDATLNQDTRSADRALDSNSITYWRTQTSPVYQPLPHHLTVDMGSEVNLTGLRYLPRQDGGAGSHAKAYELHVSLDGSNWKTVSSGSFTSNDTSPKEVYFDEIRARYFSWVIGSVFSTSLTASSAVAEISMLTTPNAASIPYLENANVGQNALQWLGQELATDPDFPKGAVKFWYQGLFGRSPMAPVTNPTAPDFAHQLAAYQTQENLLNPIAERFAQGGFKVKDLLVDLIMSDFYRANATTAPLSEAQKAALAEVGIGRLLSSDSLVAKSMATIGYRVFSNPYADMGLLYNGFDGGNEFVKGNTDITPLMLSAVESSMHAQLCDNQVLNSDLALPQEQRRLFKFIQGNETPRPFTGDQVPVGARIESSRWNDISGNNVVNLETHNRYGQGADLVSYLETFDTPVNAGDSYGERLRGYLMPAVDGDYTFWIAGDNQASLRLTLSPEIGQLSEIAKVPGYTGRYVYNTYAEQQSRPISLKAGQIYLIEVMHKEGSGGDHLSVAWSGPSFSRRTLGGNDLMALGEVTQDVKSLSLRPIKRNIQHLHELLLGEELPLDHPEIARTYRLYQKIVENQSAETGGLQIYCEIRNGAAPVRRAWNGVLAYLMADFRYLND